MICCRFSFSRYCSGGSRITSSVLLSRSLTTTTIINNNNNNNKKAKVVVIGCGRMGQIRTSLIQARSHLFQIVGIVDTVLDNAKQLANIYNTNAYENLDQVLNDEIIDGVIVSTPTFTHESIIKQIVDYNNNNVTGIFVEKPIGETAEQIEQIFEYTEKSSSNANNNNIQLCCSYQRRFDPSYVKCTQTIHNGDIGKPIMANIFFADHPIPSKQFLLTGGNIFMDLSAHDIDYIMYTLQDDIISVYATATSSDYDLSNANIHDNATMVMNFKQGATVTLFMSRSAVYGYDQRCEIFGTKGLVSINNVHENTTIISNKDGIHQSRLQHSFPQRFYNAFGYELDTFANVILDGTTWPVTKEQCINVQRVADAAKLSAESGTVIPVETYY